MVAYVYVGPSWGGASSGAPEGVHTYWTEHLCTFDMEPCRGYGKLYYSTLVTPHERNLSVLYQNRSGLTSSEPNVKGTFLKMRGHMMNIHANLREAMHRSMACMSWNAQQMMHRLASQI